MEIAVPVEIIIPVEEPGPFDQRRALRLLSHAVRRRNAVPTPIEHRFVITFDAGRGGLRSTYDYTA